MIESFSIKNYMCYREETEFSFVASKKEGKKNSLPPSWYKEIGGKRILRLLICVGINGSGKSKLFSALKYLRTLAICRPAKASEKPIYRPFLLDDHSYNEPTELQLTYYIDEICYKYRLKVSQDRIEEEELIVKESRPSRVYFRTYDSNTDKVQIIYGNCCDLSWNDRHDLEVNTVANSTVLSVFASLNLESQILSSNLLYFEDRISHVKKSDKSLADKLKTDDPDKDALMKKMILRLLKDVNTNICDYEVEDHIISVSEIEASGVHDSLVKALMCQFPSGLPSKTLKFIHLSSDGKQKLDSELESYGTMNIIRLLVVLFDIILGKKSTTIDEIEAGIHTKALEFILKMYLSLAKDCQLIVATHDLQLLNADFLRRDAVRLFNKNRDSGTISVKKPDYIHNTVSFFRTYYRDVASEIDDIINQWTVFEDYERELFGE